VGQVLVRVPFAVRLGVQVEQQGGLADGGVQQVGELAQGVRPKGVVLPPHQPGFAHLAVGGGEVVVPQQGDLLAQRVRAEQEAVEPAGLQPTDLPLRHGRVEQQPGGGVEPLRRVRVRRSVEQPAHRLLRPVCQVTLQFAPGAGERRPPVQVDHPPQVPGLPVVGRIRRPQVLGHGQSRFTATSPTAVVSPGFTV
jgi:hypothetical protein